MPKKQAAPPEPIVVRRAKVKDDFDRRRMIMKLNPYIAEDDALAGEVWDWLTLVTRTDRVEGYTLPSPNETAEAIWAKFEDYLQMDGPFAELWNEKVKAANQADGARAFLPPEELTDEEKKDTPRLGGSSEQ